MGKTLNLSNPVTLNEKINWLKLNDRRKIQTICADKVLVRDYIKDKIGEQYLVPLILVVKNANEIENEDLPEFPVIIKTNHDSGGVFMIRNKNTIDLKPIRVKLNDRLRKNYYLKSKEWQYKNIKPRILVEKLLLTKSGDIPMDYKVHCFNGKAHLIQVDIGRGSESHFRNWYDTNWERQPFKWSSPKANNKRTDPADFDIDKPTSLSEMLELSNTLAQPFDYVRIDWYNVDGTLYFGEITFHHDSGYQPIVPEEWDVKLGNLVKLGENSKKNDLLNA